MAVLTHDEQYPCAFVLRLSEWERHTTDKGGVDVKTVALGKPYTLWVKYRMALRVRDQKDIELNGGNPWTTWKEWYGDLSQFFHCFVHIPIFNFCERIVQSRIVELDYDKIKEMFYEEDKRFWDEEMNW